MTAPLTRVKLVDIAIAAISLIIFSVVPIALRIIKTNNVGLADKSDPSDQFPNTRAEAAYTIVIASSWILYLPAATCLLILWHQGKPTSTLVLTANDSITTHSVHIPSGQDASHSALARALGISGLTATFAAIFAILLASFCLLTGTVITVADRAIRSTFEWNLLIDSVSIVLLIWIMATLTRILINVSCLRLETIRACTLTPSMDTTRLPDSSRMKKAEVLVQAQTTDHGGGQAGIPDADESSGSIRFSVGKYDQPQPQSNGLPGSQDSLSE